MNNWPEPSYQSYNNSKMLIISGLIGDVHLVSRCEIFNEAPKCISQQVTRRPLALQDERYYKLKKEIQNNTCLEAFLNTSVK